jgi:hypothetical protein
VEHNVAFIMEYFASVGCCVPNMKLHKMVLSMLGSRYAIHTKARDLKDLGLGLQSGAACHIWHFIWDLIWHFILAFDLAFDLAFYSGIFFLALVLVFYSGF